MKSVLLLEDDAWFLGSLARTLKHHNYNAVTTSNPDGVFDLLDQGKFSAIIMDMHLGKFNAMTLLNEMATYDDTLKLPKIILSASGHDIKLADVQHFGVVAVLDKAAYRINDILNNLERAK